MKNSNKIIGINAIKYFLLLFLLSLTFLTKAQTPNNPTISCGKLNMT
jgi:hypothetical protein